MMGTSLLKLRTSNVINLSTENYIKTSWNPIVGSNVPLIIRVYFWASLIIMKYLFVSSVLYSYWHPEDAQALSGKIIGIIGYTISTYIFIYRREEICAIYQDGFSRLKQVSPEGITRVNRVMKWYVIVAVTYNIIVAIIHLPLEPAIVNGYDPQFDFTKYYSMYIFNFNVSKKIEITSAVIGFFSELTGFLSLRLFLIITPCLPFLIASELIQHLSRVLEHDSLNKRQLDVFNNHFIFALNYIRRLNDLMNRLLAFWFVVCLYSTFNGLIYCILKQDSNHALIISWIPYAIQDLFITTFVTICAAKIPEAKDLVLDKLLLMSKVYLAEDRIQDYNFLRSQLKEVDLGLKIAGLFLVTRRLFLSFLGMGVTYTIVYIQLNPRVLSKLQGETSTSG